MAMPELLMESRSRGICDRALLVALLMSAVLHGGVLYGAERWGGCICSFGRVVCPKIGRDCQPRVDVKLVEEPDEEPPKPPPPPPPRPKPKPRPAAIVEKPAPERPPAAPKAGKVVLPDEALAQKPARPAEIKLDRPGLPEDVVVKESEVDAPVIATGEIFGRAAELTPGEPGAFGLGGTGTAVGVGPFGTEKEGSGTSVVESPAPAPPSHPPKPRGPSRPPRVLNWTDPPYPEQARQQGIEGTAVLKLTVGADGRPGNAVVVRSSGNTALDQAALAHVKRARFSPALKDGKAVAMTITFRIRFRLVNT
jgi:protein TonB